jgi:hypothetical protein
MMSLTYSVLQLLASEDETLLSAACGRKVIPGRGLQLCTVHGSLCTVHCCGRDNTVYSGDFDRNVPSRLMWCFSRANPRPGVMHHARGARVLLGADLGKTRSTVRSLCLRVSLLSVVSEPAPVPRW